MRRFNENWFWLEHGNGTWRLKAECVLTKWSPSWEVRFHFALCTSETLLKDSPRDVGTFLIIALIILPQSPQEERQNYGLILACMRILFCLFIVLNWYTSCIYLCKSITLYNRPVSFVKRGMSLRGCSVHYNKYRALNCHPAALLRKPNTMANIIPLGVELSILQHWLCVRDVEEKEQGR